MTNEKAKEQWDNVKDAFIKAIELIPNPQTNGKIQIEYLDLVKQGYEYLEKIRTFVSQPAVSK